MPFNFLFPKEFNFFDLFDRQAACAIEAAKYFGELVKKGEYNEASVQKMREIERKADEISHEILNNLNKTFITPFDREDIHALTSEMDSIVDKLNSMTNRLRIYSLSGVVSKDLIEFSAVIEDSTVKLAFVIGCLRNLKQRDKAMQTCKEIYNLENVGDRLRDNILAKLFETEKDPINLIKWKEIFQDAAVVLDICEDVANVVEAIFVKHG
ncbi:MAG: DUF47 family protein [Candidatus Margulisiibacteriota bacterium]|jgi:hypothetical protein